MEGSFVHVYLTSDSRTLDLTSPHHCTCSSCHQMATDSLRAAGEVLEVLIATPNSLLLLHSSISLLLEPADVPCTLCTSERLCLLTLQTSLPRGSRSQWFFLEGVGIPSSVQPALQSTSVRKSIVGRCWPESTEFGEEE